MKRQTSMTYEPAAHVAVTQRASRQVAARRSTFGHTHWWEWSFPLVVSAVLLASLWMLYHTGYRHQSPGWTFMGLVGADAIDDNNVYLALMRQAAHGSMLFTNNFTSEPNRPLLVNFLYLFLGRLAHFTGWRLISVHQGFMAVTAVLAVFSMYAFIATAIRGAGYRCFALVLASFGTGFLWLSHLLKVLTGFEVRGIDAWLVELSFFHSVLVYPHFVFAVTIMAASLALFLRAEASRRPLFAAAGGVLIAILALSHAFEVVTVLPAVGTYLMLDWLGRGKVPSWERWWSFALLAAPAVATMALNQWILSREPMWGNVVSRLMFYTPPPFELVLGLGVTFIVTVVTFDGFLRTDRLAGERMAKAWVLVAIALAYVPYINWRWHLLDGIQIPLAVLATQGLRRTFCRALLLQRRRQMRARGESAARATLGPAVALLALAFVFVASASNARIYKRYREKIVEGGSPMYLPAGELKAMYWLDHAAPDDAVVFVSYATGNYLPRITGNPVFIGEDMLTEAADVRESEVAAFFGTEWTDRQRADLLQRFDVKYVFYGPDEQTLGGYVPRNAAFLATVYSAEGVEIFKVEGAAGRAAKP
jgi:hypothetical protein